VLLESGSSYPRLWADPEDSNSVWLRVGIKVSEELWFVCVRDTDRGHEVVDYQQC
jgi:hypothetical protein